MNFVSIKKPMSLNFLRIENIQSNQLKLANTNKNFKY